MVELAATFENSFGKEHIVRVNDANTELPPEQIKTSLEKLTTIKLFRKKGARLFDKLVTASFFEEIETIIFDTTSEEATYESTEQLSSDEEEDEIEAQVYNQGLEDTSVSSLTEPKLTMVEEKMIEPSVLKRVVSLPTGTTIRDFSQEQLHSFVLTVIPEKGHLLDAQLNQETDPMCIELFIKFEEKANQKNKASPFGAIRKSWQRLGRFKKRW